MDIEKTLEEFRNDVLGETFEWRRGQKEAVIEIVNTYIEGKVKFVIVSAPTGVGKSILGLAVSYCLNSINKNGYILTSEISLQNQYENDLKRFHIEYGVVSGIDQYNCIMNDEKNSLGVCRISNKAPKSMACYKECPYFKARDFASKTSTSVLNYSYYLIQQNYVNEKSDGSFDILFPKRSYTICDESHKILDIVQNHFSPRFDDKFLLKLDRISEFFKTYKVKDLYDNLFILKKHTNALYNEENQDKLLEHLSHLESQLKNYLICYTILKDKVNKEYANDTPPKEYRDALRICDYIKDMHCKIEDYCDIIKSTSIRNLIKNPTSDTEIVFNCLEENYLMDKYFHKHNNFTILMSATIGDVKEYMKSVNIKNAKYIKLDSDFNFANSPIYYYNKRRMSKQYLESNLPWLYKTIDEVLDKHKDERGIIQTASYDLTMKIFNNLNSKNKKRILVYNGTEEKKHVLEVYKRSNNKIIIGPSLVTGLDLQNDLCRFSIIPKIPYLSLGDRFVNIKMNINPSWYRQQTIITILQSLGRSIRNKNDYSTTYILDACLSDLITKNRSSFPEEFFQRIKIIKE